MKFINGEQERKCENFKGSREHVYPPVSVHAFNIARGVKGDGKDTNKN